MAADLLHPDRLKEKQRALRGGFALPLTLRVHRALSWLLRAHRDQDDLDTRFIHLWIGFNAAYAGDLQLALEVDEETAARPRNGNERARFEEYFRTLVRLDGEGRIYNALWTRFPQEIRILLDNRYVFAPFWKHHAGLPGGAGWEISFEAAKRAAHAALARGDTPVVLSILFDRLYVLRNQLLHGGATWNSKANRAQVRDGAAILGHLLPLFIDLMMDNPGEDWAMPLYPVIED
ncbi:HEPN domain-containing protein [Erythrobacter cryptus]|uniref:HEPN domain-containing protein n=1 Tax=Erythrobacter cryptus TaxID=196588 RepID=UPI00041CB46C|nr:HEPN domain-containing protein [Erythrobacter cryptus]